MNQISGRTTFGIVIVVLTVVMAGLCYSRKNPSTEPQIRGINLLIQIHNSEIQSQPLVLKDGSIRPHDLYVPGSCHELCEPEADIHLGDHKLRYLSACIRLTLRFRETMFESRRWFTGAERYYHRYSAHGWDVQGCWADVRRAEASDSSW